MPTVDLHPRRTSERARRPRAPGALALAAGVLLCMPICMPMGCSDPSEPSREGADAPVAEVEIEAEAPLPLAETLSPDARVDTFEMLEADLNTSASPADGGGHVELVRAERLGGAGPLIAGRPARFELRYTAGPLGVAVGGHVFLQPSPFWDWSSPQTYNPDAPGYTEVRSDAEGVELEVGPPLEGLVAVGIGGRALAEGEQITFVYGAGERGSLVDRYAERDAEIAVAVDGDGDGYRRLVAEGVRVDIVAGPPARIVVLGPTVVRPGEPFEVTANVLDIAGNTGTRTSGRLAWNTSEDSDLAASNANEGGDLAASNANEGGNLAASSTNEGGNLEGLPAHTDLEPDAPARARRQLVAPDAPGILRIEVRGEGELEGLVGVSNPIVVHASAPRVLWGDLHGHSQLSDGTGTPDDYFAYARDVAGLDVSALTDHDHWGLRFLDATPSMWADIKASAARHHAPGRFVTLLGYEWTSWLHGHRHVLYFEDDGPLLSSLDPAYRNPAQLWDGLRGLPALTFAHHSAGGPVATNWHFGADPVLEPVTEIVSVHGSSEAADSPDRIYAPVPGNTVRDVLMAGLRLGFIGSGDSHDGHPGLAHLASPSRSAGLAAILSEERTREGVLEALRARRSYATNGARIWLHVDLDGHTMGETLVAEASPGDPQALRVEVAGTSPVERIDLVRSGRVAKLEGFDGPHVVLDRSLPRLAPGEWHYVRVVLEDGGVAWSSPIFADVAPTEPGLTDPPTP